MMCVRVCVVYVYVYARAHTRALHLRVGRHPLGPAPLGGPALPLATAAQLQGAREGAALLVQQELLPLSALGVGFPLDVGLGWRWCWRWLCLGHGLGGGGGRLGQPVRPAHPLAGLGVHLCVKVMYLLSHYRPSSHQRPPHHSHHIGHHIIDGFFRDP